MSSTRNLCLFGVSTVIALLAAVAYRGAWQRSFPLFSPAGLILPSQSVLIKPLNTNVIGPDGLFRDSSMSTNFNPTTTTPPFFQIYHPAFLSILGRTPSIRLIASNPTFTFAHEGPIWHPSTDELFFASRFADVSSNNQVFKISLTEVAAAVKTAAGSNATVNVTTSQLDLPDSIQNINGGTALVDPRQPKNATIVLDNFFGRQFNSLNDAKILPRSGGKIFFTDVIYGYLNHFRPEPLLPSQVYRFDPDTGAVRVVADGFNKPNGLAFTKDGKTAYVTDTGFLGKFLGNDQTFPSTIYTFDVDKSHAFTNRRVFAYVDSGIPDGIQIDTQGNVYSGCGDGVHVWNSEGTLLGKFFLGSVSANMVFAGKGRLFVMAETAIYLAEIAAEGIDLSFPSVIA